MKSYILMRLVIGLVFFAISNLVVYSFAGNMYSGLLGGVGVMNADGEEETVGLFEFFRDPAKAMGMNDTETVRGGVREIPASWGWQVDGKANELLFLPDDLNVTRKLVVEHIVPFSVFLKQGEKMPEPGLRPLYAQARVAGYLAQFCHDALEVIAKKCAFLEAGASLRKDGHYNISARFAYVPSYDMGAYEKQSGYEAMSVVVKLPKRERGVRVPENSAFERKNAFQMALDACTEMRKLYKNCVLERIYLRMAYAAPKAPVVRSKAKSKGKEKTGFGKKAVRFGDNGSFGKKAGFGNKTKKGKKAKASIPQRPFAQTLIASVVVAVYAHDTSDEEKAVQALGEKIEAQLAVVE